MDALISIALQVGVVLLITLVAYAVFGRKTGSFRNWVGLTATPWMTVGIGLLFAVASAILLLHLPGVRELSAGERTVVGSAVADGVQPEVLAMLAATAIFKTAFTEELLFRGLIGKRLIAWLGFGAGNSIQAALFGAIHLLLLLSPQATPALVATIVGFTAVSGWINGWLNERLGRGSILPGWAAHAAANLTAYLGLATGVL